MTWDKTYPQSGDLINKSPPRFRDNWAAIEDTFSTDHKIPGSDCKGEHKKVSFNAPISTPSFAANTGYLYTKDVDSKAELHCLDETGNETQITSRGNKVPRTTYIYWESSTNTATVVPSGNATVVKAATGSYEITINELADNFFTYGYAILNSIDYSGRGGDDGRTGFIRINTETPGASSTVIRLSVVNIDGAGSQNSDWKLEIRQAS